MKYIDFNAKKKETGYYFADFFLLSFSSVSFRLSPFRENFIFPESCNRHVNARVHLASNYTAFILFCGKNYSWCAPVLSSDRRLGNARTTVQRSTWGSDMSLRRATKSVLHEGY